MQGGRGTRKVMSRQRPIDKKSIIAITIVIAIATWLSLAYAVTYELYTPSSTTSSLGTPIQQTIALAFTIAAIIIGTQLSQRYILLDTRGQSLFSLVFLLFSTTLAPVLLLTPFSPVVCLLALSFIPLFYTYQRAHEPRSMLSTGIYIGIAALFWSPSLLILPIYLYLSYSLQSLSPRNAIALLMGVFVPLWIVCPLAYYILPGGKEILIANAELLLSPGFYLNEIDYTNTSEVASSLIYPLLLFLLTLSSGISLSLTYHLEKVYGRVLYTSLWYLSLCLLILSLFAGAQHTGFQTLATLPIAFLTARMLSQLQRRPLIIVLSIVVSAFFFVFSLQLFF